MTNRLGPGFRAQAWIKNITNNTPEVQFIDTNGTYGTPSWTPAVNLTPWEITPLGYYYIGAKTYMYRAGACNGFVAYSHFMTAQWSTASGQRIGPAYEVEGGSGQPAETTAPAAPTGLRVF